MSKIRGQLPYDFTGTTDLGRIAAFSALLHDPSVTPVPEPTNSIVFRNMARSVHRRNGWAFAVSMASNRIGRYEAINGANLHGWHTGAGMTYLYDDDNTQYTDAFWPTIDPYRLPGTTVDDKQLADAANQGTLTPFAWAGGPVLGAYSAPGMTLGAAATDLLGKKSWFCFDEYVIAMGSAIRGGSGNQVYTVVENRNLHATGTNALTVDGQAAVATLGDTRTWTGARWAHLAGIAGYLFPRPQLLRAERGEGTGSWRDIATGGSTAKISRRYVGLTLEHGVNPDHVTYLYAVLPKATADRTRQMAESPDFEVLALDDNCHAARQAATGLTMVNLWHAPRTVGGIHANKDCGIIVQERNGTLTIAVANPLRDNATIRVNVTPAGTGYRLAAKDAAITMVSVGSKIVFDVTTGAFGETFTATFTR